MCTLWYVQVYRDPDVEQGISQDLGGSALAAFDNTGNVFAVACSQTQTVALYASKNFEVVSLITVPNLTSTWRTGA